MIQLLEVLLEVMGNDVIASHFQTWRPDAMQQTLARGSGWTASFFKHTKSTPWSSVCQTKCPTAVHCTVLLVSLPTPWVPPDTTSSTISSIRLMLISGDSRPIMDNWLLYMNWLCGNMQKTLIALNQVWKLTHSSYVLSRSQSIGVRRTKSK